MLGLARSVQAQVISSGLRWQISVLFCPDRLIRDRRSFLALMAEVGRASPDTGWWPGPGGVRARYNQSCLELCLELM